MSDLVAWLTKILIEDEALAKDAALTSGWDGFGETRITSGSEWVASYHIVKRKRAEEEPIESRKGRELADCGNMNLERAKHIAYHDPAHTFADIAAKKALIDRYVEVADWVAAGHYNDEFASELSGLETALTITASGYSDRPGYREEWRP